MISTRAFNELNYLKISEWFYKDGEVHTVIGNIDTGNLTVLNLFNDILKWERLSDIYTVTYDGDIQRYKVLHRVTGVNRIMELGYGVKYSPFDIYNKLSLVIDAINDSAERITKHNLNSFYGMYTDTDDYSEEQSAKGTVSLKHAFNSFYGMHVDSDNVMANKVYSDIFTANKVYSGDSKVYFKNASYITAAMSLLNTSKNPKFPAIKKVISNKPYSIVLWLDGTKTIVKQQPGETKYDPEKGLAMCIVKKMYGNNKWYDIFKRNLDPKYTKRKKVK